MTIGRPGYDHTRGNSEQSTGPPGVRTGAVTWPVRLVFLNMLAGSYLGIGDLRDRLETQWVVDDTPPVSALQVVQILRGPVDRPHLERRSGVYATKWPPSNGATWPRRSSDSAEGGLIVCGFSGQVGGLTPSSEGSVQPSHCCHRPPWRLRRPESKGPARPTRTTGGVRDS